MEAPYEFIAAPPIISEYNWLSRRFTYWPQMEDGHYEKKSDHQLRAYARKRGQKGDDLIREAVCSAERRVEKVRCIAGLKPGLYRDCGKMFLNPALAPLIKPPVVPDPPEEFMNLHERLRLFMSEAKIEPDTRKRRHIGEEIAMAKTRLIEIYKEAREAKPVGGLYEHPWRLLNMSRHLGKFPTDDHCRLFRSKRGFIWTSQPFGWNTAEVVGFAHHHQIEVTISPKWSWHCPGHSVLIEWRRK